jgi:transposase
VVREEGGIQLTLQEQRELLRISRDSDQPSRARNRATIILMSAEAIGAKRIAKATGTCKRVVHEARRRWRRQAYEGLYDRPHTGRPPRADGRYRRLLSRTVCSDPRKLGYAFAQWTAPRLAEYMKQQTGVGLCDDWVRMLLKSLGFVWRKTKLTIRNLQDSGGKKEGAEAALDAAEGRFTKRSELRTLVWRRRALRSAADHHLRLSTSRTAAAN